jgi:hypothetical protein
VSTGRGTPWERAQSLTDALRRAGTAGPPRRRVTEVRVYDERGQPRSLDTAQGPGRQIREAAEAMLRDAGTGASEAAGPR